MDLEAQLNRDELTLLKSKLLHEQERLLQSSRNLGAKVQFQETKDEVDSANEDILLSTTLRFSNRESFYLKKVMKALQKIEQKEYGQCEECGSFIGHARLNARPTSELCINCKEEAEKEEVQNIHARASKSMGKKIDLVSNLQVI